MPGSRSVSEEKRLSALEATLQVARVRGAYAGLHCCAARPFERMYRANPDILSFDADEGLELFFAGSDARNFLNRGGMVAYGIVPTRSGLNATDSAASLIGGCRQRRKLAIPRSLLKAQSLQQLADWDFSTGLR